MQIAIYDLDRTLTRKPTFTAFLVYGARELAPWRLLFAPIWVLAMIGYRLGFYSRTHLKQFGMKLMIGPASLERLEILGRSFAARRIGKGGEGWVPGTVAMLEQDRESGALIMIATAAFGFYARAFAEALGVEHLVATQWDGETIPGGNCYGEEKKRRVLAWLDEGELSLNSADMRFVSDSFADSPLLELADRPVFVTDSSAKAERARGLGWEVLDPRAA